MDHQQATMELKQRLHHHLTQIVRPRNPYLNSGGHFLVREYIRQSFAQWGSQTYSDLIKPFSYQTIL